MIVRNREIRPVILPDHLAPTKIGADGTARRSLAFLVRVAFFDEANLYWLISASCLVLSASAWLMLSPGLIYSRAMTWDLLYNLEGAWRLFIGQVLHVDFHEPLGTLPFAITSLGFWLVGIKPIAFVVGECVLAVAFTALGIVAVKDRLPALPGLLFVSVCAILVLVPVTIGGEPSAYTFAMGYNRFGWSAVSILCVILFIEPREERDPVWTDLAAASILTVGLFYLKITYFAIAVAGISLALLTSRHIRRHWSGWCATLLLVILVAFAPMNAGYRADIIFAMGSGAVRSVLYALVKEFALDGVEQIWAFAQIILLMCLFNRRFATVSDVLAALFIWISGFFLLSQSGEPPSIPLYGVLTLLLYARLADWLRSATYPAWMIGSLMMCALLPLLPPLLSNSLTLIGYNIKARQISEAFVVMETNLWGLAVPADHDDVFDKVAVERYSIYDPRAQFSEREYVKTILELADFLREQGAASARVIVIDQVNPLPFVLGATPARGGNLWSGHGMGWRPGEEALREIDYVAIPRFPTEVGSTMEGLKVYEKLLLTQFGRSHQMPYWVVLERLKAP